MTPEQVMKACQVGTRNHADANDLHAQCYGTIGKLLAEANRQWQPIATAPKDRYILGYDPCLKHPFVMIWNVPGQCFDSGGGFGDESPSHWMEIQPTPRSQP